MAARMALSSITNIDKLDSMPYFYAWSIFMQKKIAAVQ
ncbi:hypothetical protein TRICHSKD4_3394 [Roseibium sp. TrichSKD4]|nr:hypothetical protein TRICHSKD4_3394 [Roseibium sp. TrichSKD4]